LLVCRRLVQVERRAAQLLPDDEHGFLAASGWALAQLGRVEEARAALKDGLRIAEAASSSGGKARTGAVKMMCAELAKLGSLEPVEQSTDQDDIDSPSVEADLLCGAALVNWSSKQKAVNAHERIAVSKITPTVFLGSRFGIVDGSVLLLDSLHEKISSWCGCPLTAVVNVASLDCTYELPSFLACHTVPVRDHVDAPILPLLDAAVDFMHVHVSRGEACFVHCMGGYSRSATVLIAYLMKHRGLSYVDALTVAKTGRPQVKPNPGFVKQLLEFEHRCRSS